MTEILILPQHCEEATIRVTQTLTDCDLKVIRSFDLHHVWPLTAPDGCHCTYHGTAPCDCRVVIMLVYGQTGPPATLVAHGHDGMTWFTLVDTPEQRPLPDLAARITAALQGETCDLALTE